MSWLARSLANSLRLDDDDDANDDEEEEEENDVVSEYPHDSDPAPFTPTQQPQQQQHESEDIDVQSEEAQSRGVKEDLSELKQTLRRQIWGVASFLAPPPSQSSSPSSRLRHSEPSDQEEPFDNNAEISKMTFGSEMELDSDFEERGFGGGGGGGVGITDEVLAFASNIAMHPETWLDFPLDEEEDLDGMRVFLVYIFGFKIRAFRI